MQQFRTSTECLQLLNHTSRFLKNDTLSSAKACYSLYQAPHSTHPEHPEPFARVLAISICLILLIILENGLVILAFSMDKCLRKRSANVLVFSQASADVFTGLIFMPVYLAESKREKKNVTPFIITYMLFISLFNLFALAFDRYLALRKPFLHHRIMDIKRTIKVLVFVWLTPLFLTLIPLSWWFQPHSLQIVAFRIYLGIAWSLMLVLVTGMTVLYLFITAAARKTIRSRRKTIYVKNTQEQSKIASLARKELRVAHLFGLLLFFFVLAYFPILYMNLCDIIGRVDLIPEKLQTTSFYFLILNSIVNPVLCISLKRDYQVVVKAIVLRRQYLHRRHTSKCPFRSCSYNIVRADSIVESHLSERKFIVPALPTKKTSSSQGNIDEKNTCSCSDSEEDMQLFKLRVARSTSTSTSSLLQQCAKSVPKCIIAERERLLSILMEASSHDFERSSTSSPKFAGFDSREVFEETSFQDLH